MSLPVVLPGSCCPLPGLSAAPPAAAAAPLPSAAAPPSALPPLRSRCCRPGPAARRPPAPLQVPVPAPAPAAAPVPAPGSVLLPARPLLSLGLLQLVLGCCMVALSFGALSLSGAPQVKNACPFWAGSSVSAGTGTGTRCRLGAACLVPKLIYGFVSCLTRARRAS